MSESEARVILRNAMAPRVDPTGVFDVRYAAFLEAVAQLRPRLHRYCARMTGSVLDGEDVMQDALFEAYRKIEQLDEPGAMRPWLFRIAHNRCLDFLRSRRTRERAELGYAEEDLVLPVEPSGHAAGRAVEKLVLALPPKERACVLLKDVFDHSLEEIADLVDSTVGGVKAALSRGRAKLAALPRSNNRVPSSPRDPDELRLLERYVTLFNKRDWDGVRALTSADAQLRVSDCYRGRLADSPYFVEYERSPVEWRLEIGEVDGERALLVMQRQHGEWQSVHPVRVDIVAGRVVGITDYYACPWVLAASLDATSLS